LCNYLTFFSIHDALNAVLTMIQDTPG